MVSKNEVNGGDQGIAKTAGIQPERESGTRVIESRRSEWG